MRTFTWNDDERAHYQAVFDCLRDHFDEKATRLLGAAMALSLGPGSHTAVHAITGLAMDTIQLGIAQLQGEADLPADGSRSPRSIPTSCRPS